MTSTTIEPQRSYGVTILATLAVIGALFYGRIFLVPIALALLLSVLLRPIVRGFERIHFPTTLGAAIVVLTLFGGLIGAGFAAADPVKEWMTEAPATLKAAKAKLASVRHSIERVSKAAADLGESGSTPAAPASVPPMFSSLFGSTTALIAGIFEVLLLLFLLLASGDLFLQKLVEAIPLLKDKKAAVGITKQVQQAVNRYLSTTLLINIGQGTVVTLALWGLGLPSPWIWGILTIFLEFIPYLGAAFMIGLLSVAAFGHFTDTLHIILVPFTYLTIATIQNNLVSPIAYGQRLKLNPVAVLVGVLFWWFLWGVAGAFLAVPFIATLKIFADHKPNLAGVAMFLGE
ncbi:MAG: AI-2E family transporter [Gemmatimonadota bacterium]